MQFDVNREAIYAHLDALPIEAVAEPQRYPKAGTPNADVRIGVVSATGGETKVAGRGRAAELSVRPRGFGRRRKYVTVQRLTRVQDRLDIMYAGRGDGPGARG